MALRNNKPLGKYYLTRNTLLFRKDHYSFGANALFALKFVPHWLAEFLRLAKRRSLAAKAMIAGIVDFGKGAYGECPHAWMNPNLLKKAGWQ